MSDRFDKLIGAWMELGPSSAPERVGAAARREARSTPQARAASWMLLRYDVGAVAMVGIVVAIIVITQGLPDGRQPAGAGGSSPRSSESPVPATSTPIASSAPDACTFPAPSPEVHPGDADLSVGQHAAVFSGFSFSFCVPSRGWEPYADFHISKSEVGPQGAEGLVFWASLPGDDADAGDDFAVLCNRLPLWPVGTTSESIAADIGAMPGIELLGTPAEVDVGGRPAWHVGFVVRADVGCDPGFLYSWRARTVGALWDATQIGDLVHAWILDVDGRRMLIAGELHPEASDRLEQEILQIVRSIRFE